MQVSIHLFKDVLANMGIDSWKWIIEQVEVSIVVDSSCQADPLFLTSRQVDALLTNLSLVSSSEDVQIRFQGTSFDDLQPQVNTNEIPYEMWDEKLSCNSE